MRKGKLFWTCLFSVIAMSVLILDSKTALSGARQGIILCLYTVIPALFPFLVISTIINTALTGRTMAVLRPLGKLCGIPAGCESILILGLTGGYPVGAQAIMEAYRNGAITASTGKRLLAFCNNAGPAFVFGMLSGLFSSSSAVWSIWAIHIFSAILVSILIPDRGQEHCILNNQKSVSLPTALTKSLRVMVSVCGWVVLFRVLIAVCSRWLLWLLPNWVQVVTAGILELTNGCCMLADLPSEGLRFLLACCMLSFGGICVLMQTVSVTEGFGASMYIRGKLLQTLISFIFACVLQRFLFPGEVAISFSAPLIAVIVVILLTFTLQRKNSSKMEASVV